MVSNDPGEYLAELGMSPKSITGGNFLRITAEWVQADYNGNFIVTLSNSGGNIATAHFIYGDFAGGLTTIYEPLTWISGRENQPVTQWYLSGTFNAHPERYYGDLRLTDMSVVSAVPEIDPAGAGSVIAFVSGALVLFERRRRAAR